MKNESTEPECKYENAKEICIRPMLLISKMHNNFIEPTVNSRGGFFQKLVATAAHNIR